MNSENNDSAIRNVVERLRMVAKANNDEFRFYIAINDGRDGVSYTFVAKETADDHDFIIAQGSTPEDAAQNAELFIELACEAWGYKCV